MISDLIQQIPTGWKDVLLQYKHLEDLDGQITELFSSEIVYPPPEKIFRAFTYFEPNDTTVCILGQDPYHGEGQANGLCFGVDSDTTCPPSLRNIRKRFEQTMGYPLIDLSLEPLARQGVLMLNASLTVRKGTPSSHMSLWLDFSNYILEYIDRECPKAGFVAWGAFALRTLNNVTPSKIFVSSHPSPLSAMKPFRSWPAFMDSDVFLHLKEKYGVQY